MSKGGEREAARPTMAVVAELAGVSKITVSRALNGSPLVRPEVRERIAEVARAAGYRLNVAARNLRTRRSRTVADFASGASSTLLARSGTTSTQLLSKVDRCTSQAE